MIRNREQLEEIENMKLAPFAVHSSKSGGRHHDEGDEDARLCFEKDRDRIIHSKAFRRLDRKTQVLMSGSGDHYRTRLTHTLEVAQISRGLARRLGLNEDLCEAIALAHDLGHSPFGHGGEDALDEIMRKHGMTFEHNEQSRRVVEELEDPYPDFKGLNLTIETLEGMIKHQTAWDQRGKKFAKFAHLEAQIVNIADEIAYTNHDIDDGLRSGAIFVEQLKELKLWQRGEELVREQYGELEGSVYVSRVISSMISIMMNNLCEQTESNIVREKITSLEDVKNFEGKLAHFNENLLRDIAEMRKFLYDNFYMNARVVDNVRKGKLMINKVFEHLLKNEPDPVLVKDYIAGMTDGFLVAEFDKISS